MHCCRGKVALGCELQEAICKLQDAARASEACLFLVQAGGASASIDQMCAASLAADCSIVNMNCMHVRVLHSPRCTRSGEGTEVSSTPGGR